jgi:hypothetical protein
MKTLLISMALALLAVDAVPAAEPARSTAPATATTRAAPRPDAAKPQAAAQPTAPTPAATSTSSTIELDTTQITGNRELPRVLYVVPWKRADLGELSGKPTRSLLDEVLAPVDRDVFQRQNRYHDALQPDAAAKAPAVPQAN